jgi:hypothetical protein
MGDPSRETLGKTSAIFQDARGVNSCLQAQGTAENDMGEACVVN